MVVWLEKGTNFEIRENMRRVGVGSESVCRVDGGAVVLW